jgi:CheY-like chemotaxis protein
MNATHARVLLDRIAVLRHPSDVDLLIFFTRHPRALMDNEQLATFLGYEITQIAESLDVLLKAEFLRRIPNRARAALVYVFAAHGPTEELLQPLVELACTREGRLAIRWVLKPRPASGTEVTIRLPLVEAAAAEGAGPISARTSGLQRLDGLCILLVEDDEDSREATSLTLERLGADVLMARNGVDALETVMTDHLDLVVCDLQMPRMDGFEFLHALRKMEGHTNRPVIAISGLASSADHHRIKAAGFAGYIDKPFDHGRLLAALDDAMATPDPFSS